MIEIIQTIAMWCAGYDGYPKIECQQKIMLCILKDVKSGDGKEALNQKLLKCLDVSKK